MVNWQDNVYLSSLSFDLSVALQAWLQMPMTHVRISIRSILVIS